MKKLFLLGAFLMFSVNIHAQDSKAERVKNDVKRTANNIADKTEEAAVKTGHAVKKTAIIADNKARKIHKEKVAATKKARKSVDRTAAKIENKATKAVD